MKNLISILIPLLFLGCKKDELPIEVSEGTRLVKIDLFYSGQSLNESPNQFEEYFYDNQNRLIGRDWYYENSPLPLIKYRKEYNESGNLEKISSSKLKDGNYELSAFYIFQTNPVTQQIENASKYLIPHEGGDAQKEYERHFIYNDYHQIILDTLFNPNIQSSNQFPANFQYQWKEDNVVRIEKLSINGEILSEIVLKYDGKTNPDPSNHIKTLFMLRSDIIPVGLNNVIEAQYYDFTGSGPRRTCNPCRTNYKYNSFGLPYFSSSNGGDRRIYTYEKE
ncbi:MAG: hypothetical protein EA362_08160 [Saprospirales bacterium]|nr:MAG: hypothetical protein EA362_08160 [Saprospirales bacterium]